MSNHAPAAVVVLAAGEGKRMRSALAKVLHAICGRSLLGHVLAATDPLGATHTVVVVGHNRDQIIEHLKEIASTAIPVVQEEQLGTGHAVRMALKAAGVPGEGTVLVLPGDAPLITTESLQALLAEHSRSAAAATLLTSEVADPSGYGRVVRRADGQVMAIVEDRDADEATKAIREIGTSIYAFDGAKLRAALARVTTDNAQGEEYLTDVIGLLVGDGEIVSAVTAPEAETLGVNDRIQLAAVRRTMRDRIVAHWMREGVTVIDPQTTWMGVGVTLEPDCVIHQNTQLHGATHVAAFAEVGPDTTLRNTNVGPGAKVVKSHCTGAEIGEDADVGPFSYLRPGTRLGARGKIGAYVETKKAEIGEDSKVPHLSYVGDARIGERSNIGAATVFVNYDGENKHQTVVGDDVRVGSDSMLVAPVTIGDGAYTAAGSVVTEDVPPGALAVARSKQRNVEDWVEKRRPDSPAAKAARRARGADQRPDEQQATMEATSPVDSEL
ncbi:MAG TPA: bifunctional UDP-N-acetylglucosamine diphosphorylase/glucosamine-1-phosphate N-acetyltransferase GlmU [Mycobacteriales bacterium]|nr:bifunctional UDP-N-acetylglucosamine diphosphorylase/glucosamine-1-phosphate N-acetyltransferase GlmU [Mycobacteriales bacterium]